MKKFKTFLTLAALALLFAGCKKQNECLECKRVYYSNHAGALLKCQGKPNDWPKISKVQEDELQTQDCGASIASQNGKRTDVFDAEMCPSVRFVTYFVTVCE